MTISRSFPELTARQRDGSEPPCPGQILGHASGEDTGPDVGLEVGLSKGVSIYIGEVADETVAGCGITALCPTWWIFLRDERAGTFIPIAPMNGADQYERADDLTRAIRSAIISAQVLGGFATADAEAKWIEDMEAGVYDTDMPTSIDWGRVARANADDTGMLGGGPVPPEALIGLPHYATVAAAVVAEGPIREFLKALRRDEVTRTTALSDRLVAVLAELQAIIDSAPLGGMPQ